LANKNVIASTLTNSLICKWISWQFFSTARHDGRHFNRCVLAAVFSMFGVQVKTWQQCYILQPELGLAALYAGRAKDL
jgi:hypothetical protein